MTKPQFVNYASLGKVFAKCNSHSGGYELEGLKLRYELYIHTKYTRFVHKIFKYRIPARLKKEIFLTLLISRFLLY